MARAMLVPYSMIVRPTLLDAGTPRWLAQQEHQREARWSASALQRAISRQEGVIGRISRMKYGRYATPTTAARADH